MVRHDLALDMSMIKVITEYRINLHINQKTNNKVIALRQDKFYFHYYLFIFNPHSRKAVEQSNIPAFSKT